MGEERISEERIARLGLLLAMAVASITILWLGRGTTFWIDELTVYMQSPDLGLRDALRPHLGHLVVVVRVVNKATFELFGASYLPFRLLTLGSLLLTVSLLFTYMRRRVPPLVALAPCLVLLFFGSDFIHILAGNGFGVLLAISCGLGALLALESENRRLDLVASGLLCLGLCTYSVALAFLAGAIVLILLSPHRWRRIWVVAIPILLYGTWLIWAAQFEKDAESQVQLYNLLTLPSWSFKSLSYILGSLSGFDYQFPNSSLVIEAGPALAVVALVGFALRFNRGSIPPSLWAALAVVAAFWCLGVLAAQGSRTPDSARYLYPGATALLLVASGSAAGMRWSRSGLVLLYVFAASGFAVNLYLMKESGIMLRSAYAVQVKAGFAGLDLAAKHAQPRFDPPPVPGGQGVVPGGQSPLGYPFSIVAEAGASPSDAYRIAAQRYGSLGYSLPELRSTSDGVRTQTDSILVAALGVKLQPVAIAGRYSCRTAEAGPDGIVRATLPPSGVALRSSSGGSVALQRFARDLWIPIGALAPGKLTQLRIPTDRAPDRWRLSVASQTLSICRFR